MNGYRNSEVKRLCFGLRNALLLGLLFAPLIMVTSLGVSLAGERIVVPPALDQSSKDYFRHWIAYGERADMEAEIVARAGIDTAAATVTTRPSTRSAIRRCAFEVGEDHSVTANCVKKELGYAPPATTLHANCITGEFESFPVPVDEAPMKFLGVSEGGTYYFQGISDPHYLPDPENAGPTSYDMVFTAWMALCPRAGRNHILSQREVNLILNEIKANL